MGVSVCVLGGQWGVGTMGGEGRQTFEGGAGGAEEVAVGGEGHWCCVVCMGVCIEVRDF